jgi:RNA polymerase sigma factor (sigma-70 family)
MEKNPVEEFEQNVWCCSPEQLRVWLPKFNRQCQLLKRTLSTVLAEQSDETLALAIRKGLLVAEVYRELIWNRYIEPKSLLSAWLRRIGRFYGCRLTEEDTDNLGQQLHVRLLKNRFKNYDPQQTFDRYLFGIAKNLFLDSRREKQYRQLDNDFEPAEPESQEGIRQELEETISNLPEKQQLVLSDLLNGETVAEIAAKRGWPLHKVYRLRTTAIASLRKRWELVPANPKMTVLQTK